MHSLDCRREDVGFRVVTAFQEELSLAGDLRVEGLSILLKHAEKFRFGAADSASGQNRLLSTRVFTAVLSPNKRFMCFGNVTLTFCGNCERIRVHSTGLVQVLFVSRPVLFVG